MSSPLEVGKFSVGWKLDENFNDPDPVEKFILTSNRTWIPTGSIQSISNERPQPTKKTRVFLMGVCWYFTNSANEQKKVFGGIFAGSKFISKGSKGAGCRLGSMTGTLNDWNPKNMISRDLFLMEIVQHPFFHGKELESSNWNNRPLTRGCLGFQVSVSSSPTRCPDSLPWPLN